MDYYCDLCDRSNEIKSKNKHLTSLTHNEFEKCIKTKHTMKNPDLFDIDEIFNDYSTNHNKKINIYLVNYQFCVRV